MFRRNLLLLSARFKHKPKEQDMHVLLVLFFYLFLFFFGGFYSVSNDLVYFIEWDVFGSEDRSRTFPETSVNFYRTTWRNNPDDYLS
jgi:hypothetical protein